MTAVVWSPQAIRDVESIRAFIAQDSPSYAELETRRIVAVVERQRLPRIGASGSRAAGSIHREVIVAPYRVVYRLRGDVVEVATVFRASRQLPDFIR